MMKARTQYYSMPNSKTVIGYKFIWYQWHIQFRLQTILSITRCNTTWHVMYSKPIKNLILYY